MDKNPVNVERKRTVISSAPDPLLYPQPAHKTVIMSRIHLHLLSDSTGETLENIAKAAIGLFENVEAIRHFWPMVRSEVHLDRIMEEIAANPGLVLFTLTNHPLRRRLEARCRALGLPHVAALDGVADALSNILGQETRTRPGRKHILDEAYFARIEAIQFTIAHDDGVGHENWEEADIVLAGVSRASKTPTSIYLANRGYKTANIPLVPQSPPPRTLFTLKHPMVVGLTVSSERLIQIRRNRLLSLNQAPETSYVDSDKVQEELAFARRMFADNGWPVIDMTRRSIEEAAAAIINLFNDRVLAEG
ncbi:PEP synthetase regulatory protein [Sphingobium ummariense RL-3]|uniref:Putative pyruvate, phosphate dikinase regulatory protein n=2 Tax=Sphingobium TaxID=165695 RepID=T0IQ89_9SPHN|nr:PEP synthetase regulatory protein [Sphingobium ummariense RL-3]